MQIQSTEEGCYPTTTSTHVEHTTPTLHPLYNALQEPKFCEVRDGKAAMDIEVTDVKTVLKEEWI